MITLIFVCVCVSGMIRNEKHRQLLVYVLIILYNNPVAIRLTDAWYIIFEMGVSQRWVISGIPSSSYCSIIAPYAIIHIQIENVFVILISLQFVYMWLIWNVASVAKSQYWMLKKYNYYQTTGYFSTYINQWHRRMCEWVSGE